MFFICFLLFYFPGIEDNEEEFEIIPKNYYTYSENDTYDYTYIDKNNSSYTDQQKSKGMTKIKLIFLTL